MHNRNQDHASTLLIPGAGTSGSPIGHGFAVVWHMLSRRSAPWSRGVVRRDEDGDEAVLDPWRTAGGALLDAAMAFGAPHLVDSHALAVLTRAWNVVFPSLNEAS